MIFDGSCGFCVATIRLAERLDAARAFAYVPAQVLAFEELADRGITPEACARELLAVDQDLLVRGGADAVNVFLLQIPVAAPCVRMLCRMRTLVWLERLAYRLVARNRVSISRLLGTAKYAQY